MDEDEIKKIINPHKETDRQFYLDLLDPDVQRKYETQHIRAVLYMLKNVYIKKLQERIASDVKEKAYLSLSGDYNAETYRTILGLDSDIASANGEIESYRPFFAEPYFARMDVEDDREGYNSYYIGKKGDDRLEIVDWRAPLARRYYQKSKLSFTINEYSYRVILRRALRTKNGKLIDMQNEYLSLKDHLPQEDIAGRDENVIFDPYLKEILRSRKERSDAGDIIETIQEKQFEIITLPENEEFVVQGVAGTGKTMIMLHRLSYLMYNNESIRPENVLVITPSDSFNAFIDELSAVLELEKVRTSTLSNYYVKILAGCGIDVSGRIDGGADIPTDYLGYIYSADFMADVDAAVSGVYDNIHGLISGDDADDFSSAVERACVRQEAGFEKIQNASIRVRRCILGEIKEKPDGGICYTKPMRDLFNAVYDVHEYLQLVRTDERMKSPAYLMRETMSFGKSLRYIGSHSDRDCADAVEDLKKLAAEVRKEIGELRRYRRWSRAEDERVNAERIEKREQMLSEIEEMSGEIEDIHALFASVCDYADVIGGESSFEAVSRCVSVGDIASFFYGETVVPAKKKYGTDAAALNSADPFALCLILSRIGFDLTPKFSYIFVDEAQDLSETEYILLRAVNGNAKFNIFGDLRQNITPWRGVKSWDCLSVGVYTLRCNYRNTNQIVNFVSDELGVDMLSVGFDGSEVERISRKKIEDFFSGKKGLRAVICPNDTVDSFSGKRGYSILRKSGTISREKINVMTVYESKGLEFSSVAVITPSLTDNERYIAYTRALSDLAEVR